MSIPPPVQHPFVYKPSDIQQGYEDGYAAASSNEHAAPAPSRSARYKAGFFRGVSDCLGDRIDDSAEEERDIYSQLSRAGYYREERCQ